MAAEKRYFTARQCAFNKQFFPKYHFYTESDLLRGLGPRDKPSVWVEKDANGKDVVRPYNKYMVEISIPKKERRPEMQALIDEAITAMEGDLEMLKSQGIDGRMSRGIGSLIKKTEDILQQVKAA